MEEESREKRQKIIINTLYFFSECSSYLPVYTDTPAWMFESQTSRSFGIVGIKSERLICLLSEYYFRTYLYLWLGGIKTQV